jgi:hypothetical protein
VAVSTRRGEATVVCRCFPGHPQGDGVRERPTAPALDDLSDAETSNLLTANTRVRVAINVLVAL